MSYQKQVEQAAKVALSHGGQSVTLVNQEAQTDGSGNIVRDSYNDPEWKDPTQTGTKASLVQRGTPDFAKRADGVSEEIDVIVRLDPNDPVTDGSDDEGTKATRIELDSATYVIRSSYIASDELRECHCKRED